MHQPRHLLSQIGQGQLSASIERVLVREVLEQVRTALEPMAARQGIRIELDLLAPQAKVAADRKTFVQILMNLGSNAIQYNRAPGKVTFSVRTTRPGKVRIAVRDTGMGIAPDEQDKLFQPFQRAQRDPGSLDGPGIGLVIARRLAQSMGAEVGFRSIWGEGSEFWVDMPVDESHEPASDVLRAGQEDIE